MFHRTKHDAKMIVNKVFVRYFVQDNAYGLEQEILQTWKEKQRQCSVNTAELKS